MKLLYHNNRYGNVKSRRSGLSLLEILASVFVLMIGLLGIVAVVPYGVLQVAKINKADYGGNCGRAAIQTIRAHKLAASVDKSFYDPFFDIGNQRQPDGNNFSNTIGAEAAPLGNPDPNAVLESFVLCERPFLVDPLAICSTMTANNSYDFTTANKLWTFPANNDYGIPRVSCTVPPIANRGNSDDWKQEKRWAWLTFHSQEDRLYAAAIHKNPGVEQSARPIGVQLSEERRKELGDKGLEHLIPEGISNSDDYSWMYMVTPQCFGKQYALRHNVASGITGYAEMGDRYFDNFLLNDITKLRYYRESEVVGYNVDVIVFYKRDIDPARLRENERILPASKDVTGGYRGGPFTLTANLADFGDSVKRAKEALDLTDTHWLLLMYQEEPDNVDTRKTAKWYKIVNYGDIEKDGDSYTRRLMLLGPDVPENVITGSSGVSYRATLAKGAIHVFSAFMTKEEL